MRLIKIHTNDNPADILTKYVSTETLQRHLQQAGIGIQHLNIHWSNRATVSPAAACWGEHDATGRLKRWQQRVELRQHPGANRYQTEPTELMSATWPTSTERATVRSTAPSTPVEFNSDFQFNRRCQCKSTSLINISLCKVYSGFNTLSN